MKDERIYIGLMDEQGKIIDADVIEPFLDNPKERLREYMEKGYHIIDRETADEYATKSLVVLLRG